MLRIPHCLDNRLTDGGKVVSLTHRPHSTAQIHYYFYVSLLITVFGMHQSASTVMRKAFDRKRSRISMLQVEALRMSQKTEFLIGKISTRVWSRQGVEHSKVLSLTSEICRELCHVIRPYIKTQCSAAVITLVSGDCSSEFLQSRPGLFLYFISCSRQVLVQ
jgi:hypothetical protein